MKVVGLIVTKLDFVMADHVSMVDGKIKPQTQSQELQGILFLGRH